MVVKKTQFMGPISKLISFNFGLAFCYIFSNPIALVTSELRLIPVNTKSRQGGRVT